MEKLKVISNNKNTIARILKIFMCAIIIAVAAALFFFQNHASFYNIKTCTYQNNFTGFIDCTGYETVSQTFTSKGSELSDITIFTGSIPESDLEVSLYDGSRKLIAKTITPDMCAFNTWNTFNINCKGLKKGNDYILTIKGEKLSGIVLNENNASPDIFHDCTLNGVLSSGTLALGIVMKYNYISVDQLLYILSIAALNAATVFILCFTVLHSKQVLEAYKSAKSKTALMYSVFFATNTAMLFYPLESGLNKPTEFDRQFGIGFIQGVDVTKRINSFFFLFLLFALSFVIFYLYFNYFLNKSLSEENKKVLALLNDLIVAANICLVFKGITFFFNENQSSNPVFNYSNDSFMLMILLALGFIALRLDEKILAEDFKKLIIVCFALSFPLALLISEEWGSGQALVGIQILFSVSVTLFVKFVRVNLKTSFFSGYMNFLAVFLSCIPFAVSLFMELIIIFNRHGVFFSDPFGYFPVIFFVFIFICGLLSYLLTIKKVNIRNWKSFAYPIIIFGISCLWCQIAVTGIYDAHLFESANASILISDFLNFGSVPIVEHYGGHMMQGVWEGIIYSVLNNDPTGAIFTPYSGYIAAVIAILFYYTVKNLWSEDAALATVLFIPFYSMITYWGLGLLTGLGALLYIRKNTLFRAFIFWFTVIWCTIYRLDIGFAFALACIVALVVYIISERNFKALKQLIISLACWATAGILVWTTICLVKNIDPINRLIEFLMLSMSNINWAYSTIGDASTAMFSWAYIFIPFAVIICMLVSIFSKKIKRNIGKDIWIFMLIFGFSYFFNFSRGIVRHSLAESALYICVWSAYIFLAMFVSAYKKRKYLFVIIFSFLMLGHSLFVNGSMFNDTPIASAAVSKMGSYAQMWKKDSYAEDDLADSKTLWQQIGGDSTVIQRINLTDNLRYTVDEYDYVLKKILDEDETFVDFTNNTFIYSALNKRNPVYVSQSPLQLSGEFAQEQFIEEMEWIPIVLIDGGGIDGIANSYRYYKVSEYIYSYYTPLCTVSTDRSYFTVCCLKERYDDMKKKLLSDTTDITTNMLSTDKLGLNSSQITENGDGSVTIGYTGIDPYVSELQNIFDITPYIGKSLTFFIDYESDISLDMQLFYTTEDMEEYSEEKSIRSMLTDKGTVTFTVPVTEFSRFRIDIPEGSTVKINSFQVSNVIYTMAYYDQGSTIAGNHYHDLCYLPSIWAEHDKRNSADNTVLQQAELINGMYCFDVPASESGNYIKVSFNSNCPEKECNTYLKIGKTTDGLFEEKYSYCFKAQKGQHDYIFRVSSDFYWYYEHMNSAVIESDYPVNNVTVQVLEGD